MSATATAAVELRGVSKRFGSVVALREVDLTVEAGEFLTLLGPSGCGKTTLLRLIGGFDSPDTGSVWLSGTEVTAVPPYRRAVNTVFQNYALFPHLTVAENVSFGLKMQKAPKAEIAQRVAEALALVSLGGLEARKPHQLSGGQRQRVALARALVCRPKVLLLDEPLAALDAKLRHAMQLELKALQRKVGLTFIFVTHDQQEALAMSDRIALLNDGRIEQIGAAADIYTQPKTAFVADFIGRANLIEVQVGQVAASGPGKKELRCQAADGSIWRVSQPPGLPVRTDKLVLVVRPERIAVSSAPIAGENGFSAVVVDCVFKGASTEVLMRCASGGRLSAVAPSPLLPGTEVWCNVQPDDIVVLGGARCP